MKIIPQNSVTNRAGLAKAEWLAIAAAAALLLSMLVPAILPQSTLEREKANRVQCQANLRTIGQAFQQYLHENAGQLPRSNTLENPHPALTHALSPYLTSPQVFYCPSLPDPDYSPDHFRAGDIGYFYYEAAHASTDPSLSKFLLTGLLWPRELSAQSPPNSWLMSDIWKSAQPTAHTGFKKGVNYLTLDGSVSFTPESPRRAFH